MKNVLIITKRIDIHADLVIRRIRDLGGKFIRLNYDDVPQRTRFAFRQPYNSSVVVIGEKTYETFEISPDMKNLEQLVKKDANPTFKIWITSDGQCIPVKIQSSVGIVSFIFELASIEP